MLCSRNYERSFSWYYVVQFLENISFTTTTVFLIILVYVLGIRIPGRTSLVDMYKSLIGGGCKVLNIGRRGVIVSRNIRIPLSNAKPALVTNPGHP